MPVDTTHALYDEFAPDWDQMRDFLGGQRKVKAAGEKYLPRLQDQENAEYEAYVRRALFLNAVGRTHIALLGMVFLKDPTMTVPDSLKDALETDADLAGNSFYAVARQVVSETLAVGRCATYIDWDERESRPYLTFFPAESILNWLYARVNNKWVLKTVVLREEGAPKLGQAVGDEFAPPAVEQIRVVRLLIEAQQRSVQVEIYQRKNVDGKAGDWTSVGEFFPVKNGKPLTEIPVIFHSPTQKNCGVERPPLEDLKDLNLTHYRIAADHNHGLHFVALPTAWVAGFDKSATLRMGASTAWVSDNVQARAGFLEFTGAGLGAIRNELTAIETSMAVMGARLLEQQKRAAEAAETLQIRQAGESSVLSNIAGAISVSMTKVLQWCEWWMNSGVEDRSDLDDEKVSVVFNSDFGTARMTGAEVQALVGSWMTGGISRKTLFWNLQQGEIIPPETTLEQEIELIGSDTTLPAFQTNDDSES